MAEIIPFERIEQKIYFVRGKKVMLDRDLGELYGVTTGNLNKAVNRNPERFPDDFMFELNKEEMVLIFQNGISKKKGGVRKPAHAYTEHGSAMLSSVLKSKRAVLINIQIMRTFIRLREMMSMNKDVFLRLNKHDAHLAKHDKDISTVFEAIHCIMELPVTLRRKPKPIGFKPEKE